MATWRDYLRQARRFWDVAEATDDSEHAKQAVSNAIHAAIAANDAVCLYLGGERASRESHAEAARVLRRVCKGTEHEKAATAKAKQLTEVLQAKNAAQYEGRPMGKTKAARIMKQARRFVEWAEEALPPPPV